MENEIKNAGQNTQKHIAELKAKIDFLEEENKALSRANTRMNNQLLAIERILQGGEG